MRMILSILTKGGAASSGELTFVFPGTAKGVVPYADDIKASAQENELETLDIYVFGEDSLSSATPKPMLLEEIFRSGVGASTDQGEQGFALSTVGDAKTQRSPSAQEKRSPSISWLTAVTSWPKTALSCR